MLDNLTREIVLYSLVPVVIIVIIDFIAYFVMRKKEENERFSFNYFIKVSLIIAISFVISLIGGYDIWLIGNYIRRGILSNNIWYVALIVFLWVALLTLLIWLYLKSLKEFKEEQEA